MKCRIALCLVLIVAMIPMGCALADALTIDLGKATLEELIAARMKIDATLIKASAEGALEKAPWRAPALSGQTVTVPMRGRNKAGEYTAKIAITLDRVYRGPEFMELVKDAGLHELSSPDMEYVGAKFTVSYLETVASVENKDPEFFVDETINFKVFSGDGAEYKAWHASVPGQKEFEDIREGETTEGFLYFELPKHDVAPYVAFREMGSPTDEVWFLLK